MNIKAFSLCLILSGLCQAAHAQTINEKVFREDGTVDFSVLEQQFEKTAEDKDYLELSEKMMNRIKHEGVSPDVAYSDYINEMKERRSKRSDKPITSSRAERDQAAARIRADKETLVASLKELEARRRAVLAPTALR